MAGNKPTFRREVAPDGTVTVTLVASAPEKPKDDKSSAEDAE